MTPHLDELPVHVGSEMVLRALSHPQRRQIMAFVQHREFRAGQIAQHFDLTPWAVSQHLGVLTQAGLLHERRVGTRRFFALRPDSLQSMRTLPAEFWPDALGRLKQSVERDHRGTHKLGRG